MILFWNDDRSYLNWIARRRGGFVMDCAHPLAKGQATLHRATCRCIRVAAAKRTHWTTGKHMKCCSLDADELRRWSLEQCGREARLCAECRPGETPAAERPTPDHLTRLDQRIVSCILEIAAYHLDMRDGGYDVTVGMIAGLLAKTPGQLAEALHRLVADGLIEIRATGSAQRAIARHEVFPTVKALRTLEAYAAMDETAIARELEQL